MRARTTWPFGPGAPVVPWGPGGPGGPNIPAGPWTPAIPWEGEGAVTDLIKTLIDKRCTDKDMLKVGFSQCP